MKKFTPVLVLLLVAILATQLSFRSNSVTPHQWYAPAFPSQLNFCNEKVPLERWDVKERFDREYLLNYYEPGALVYLHKLANRIFPVISQRLKANGIPDDFKYLCIAESNMQNWAVSKSGAVGYWQFLNGTAPGFGLEVSDQVDQRQDLEKSTDAACKYFKQAYAKFGSWTAAAASYNCGQGGYSSQASFQQTNNYFDLFLPEETNKYIFRILAFKHLFENSGQLGYTVSASEKYVAPRTKSVEITKSISNLASYAAENGTTYQQLRSLNPWIKARALAVKPGGSYTIRIPE